MGTTYVVNCHHREASDQGEGTEERPFLTISAAAEIAEPGDTILVREGVYRERVTPRRGGVEGKPIVYRAAEGERPVVKGSDRLPVQWEATREADIYIGRCPAKHLPPSHPFQKRLERFEGMASTAWFKRNEEQMEIGVDGFLPPTEPEGILTLGQLFADGRMLQEVMTKREVEETPGSWMYLGEQDGEASWYVHVPDGMNPHNSEFEFTVRGRIFAPKQRGLGYIHVSGFIFEHCGNNFPYRFWERADTAQAGALGMRSGHHWVVENNVVRFAKTVGIDCGAEGLDIEGDQPILQQHEVGYHRIRNNTVSDNGAAGIIGWNHTGTHIVGNTVERNNWLQSIGFSIAGIKMLIMEDGLIADNTVRDNECFGIWIDNQVNRTRVTGNIVHNNREVGIFCELLQGPTLIDNNIVTSTRYGVWSKRQHGQGIYSHDASGFTLANNYVADSAGTGIKLAAVWNRSFPGGGLSQVRDVRIFNNILVGNKGDQVELPYPGTRSSHLLCEGNVYSDESTFKLNASAESFEHKGRVERQQERIREKFRSLFPQEPETDEYDFRQWRVMAGCDWNSAVADAEHIRYRTERQIWSDVPGLHCPAITDWAEEPFASMSAAPLPDHPGPARGVREAFRRMMAKSM